MIAISRPVGAAGGKTSRGVTMAGAESADSTDVRAELRDAANRVEIRLSKFKMRIAKFGRGRSPRQFQRSFQFRLRNILRKDFPGRIRIPRDTRDNASEEAPAGAASLRPAYDHRGFRDVRVHVSRSVRAQDKSRHVTMFESSDARAFAALVRTL